MAYTSQEERESRYRAAVDHAVVIEIGEDAYKQNTIYCSWQEILDGESELEAVASPDEPLPDEVDCFPPAEIRRP